MIYLISADFYSEYNVFTTAFQGTQCKESQLPSLRTQYDSTHIASQISWERILGPGENFINLGMIHAAY